jgi:hypothetical protein
MILGVTRLDAPIPHRIACLRRARDRTHDFASLRAAAGDVAEHSLTALVPTLFDRGWSVLGGLGSPSFSRLLAPLLPDVARDGGDREACS